MYHISSRGQGTSGALAGLRLDTGLTISQTKISTTSRKVKEGLGLHEVARPR
jgi:hypothetical protein